uniref:Bacterial surface antigen (D15) domain-containing protein n=1 Tax=candidate division WOR-3 bacterium TaxID=2052148 RepID=A0A7V3PTU0_UNCW3
MAIRFSPDNISFPCRLLLILCFLIFLLTTKSIAQFTSFGKNKVQTRDYQFQSFETEHFKILFYPGGEGLAEFASKALEDYYQEISQALNTELESKVPVILYLSPGHFSETNFITDLIEEGVGGFSEPIKNRIVVPFNGSYQDFYHVLGHELTHIFEFQMFYRSRLAALLGAVGEFQVPLWIMEGFAEFQSGWVNVESEIFMRDLVINNRLLSLTELNDNYGYLAYREGEAFFNYVAERYGREKVYEFMNTLKAKRNLDATFNTVFGMSITKFSQQWEQSLKVKYLPRITKITNFEEIAQRLTDHKSDGSIYNTGPALSPSGTKIAMISDRAEYTDLYIISALTGEVQKKLVRGERSGGFEGLLLLRPGVAWSPDEKTLAVVTRSSGRDNIALVDVRSGRVKKHLFAELDGIYTPKFSPDGKSLLFVGLKNGFSDIYLLEIDEQKITRLTYDMFEDKDPCFSPGGDSIVFVSDRPEPGQVWIPGQYAVWLRDEKGELHQLSSVRGYYGYPVWTHSGDYLFWVAADSSSRNICVYSVEDQRVIRKTDFLGEVSYLSLDAQDRKLVFAYFSNSGWDVSVIFDPLTKIPQDTGINIVRMDTVKFERSGLDFDRVKPVGFSLALDYAAGSASWTPGATGFSGTVYIEASDILGNHRFGLYTDLYGDILNSNFLFRYWLLPHRIDYGFAVFQLFDIPYYVPEQSLVQTVDRGGQFIISYPFDKFTRLEAGLTGVSREMMRWLWEGGWYLAYRNNERLFYGTGAIVFDNTFWQDYLAPVRGTRARLELLSSFLSNHQFDIISGDIRNYLRMGRRFVFANRLQGRVNFGDVPDYYYYYYLGGEDVRGYNWGEFYQDTGPGIFLFNLELRYPFIDRLQLAFPIPLDIKGIRGVLFFDGGIVLRDGMRVWNNGQLEDLKLGAGAGLRIPFTFFNIKLDFARPLSRTTDRNWKFIFELGYDF